MPKHWIDTDSFIEAKNGLYSFDIAPEFWAFLDSMNDEGLVASSTLVRDELLKGTDELEKWAREHKPTAILVEPDEDAQMTLGAEWGEKKQDQRSTSMFVEPDEDTQMAFRRVSEYVTETYAPNQARKFLGVADPWLIAHAMASGGKVVTQETRVGENSPLVKIPNVCDAFGVESMNIDDMLHELGASFS